MLSHLKVIARSGQDLAIAARREVVLFSSIVWTSVVVEFDLEPPRLFPLNTIALLSTKPIRSRSRGLS